jgi:hypothetical protein
VGRSEQTLPLSSQEIMGVSRTIVYDLVRADQIPQIPPGDGLDPAITAVSKALKAYFAEEAALEKDAAQMAAQHLKAAGRDAVGLDTRKVTLMIKQRLAKERGFPL